MPFGPSEEDFRDLTRLYGEMSDGELLNLRASIEDLTDHAQSALRDELKKRHLSTSSPVSAGEGLQGGKLPGDAGAVFSLEAELAQEGVVLCECETREQAGLACYVLEEAGISSIFLSPEQRLGLRFPSVVVGPDDLERARAVLKMPIAQSVRDEYEVLQAAGEFQLPVCPRCASTDILLEAAEPNNEWVCDACGHRWQESGGEA